MLLYFLFDAKYIFDSCPDRPQPSPSFPDKSIVCVAGLTVSAARLMHLNNVTSKVPVYVHTVYTAEPEPCRAWGARRVQASAGTLGPQAGPLTREPLL